MMEDAVNSEGPRDVEPRNPPPLLKVEQLPARIRLPLDRQAVEDSYRVSARYEEIAPGARVGELLKLIFEPVPGLAQNDIRSAEHAVHALKDGEYLTLKYHTLPSPEAMDR